MVEGSQTTQCTGRMETPFFLGTHWNIQPEDIIRQYHQDIAAHHETSLVRAVDQVFGYLGEGKLQFGALSTYNYSWFLQRPKEDTDCLRISEGIPYSSTDPGVLKCYVYVINLAISDPSYASPVTPMQNNKRIPQIHWFIPLIIQVSLLWMRWACRG